MRQAHKTIELPLPPDVTDVMSLRRLLTRDLGPTETIVSIMLDATDEEVTDEMVQQWRARPQPSTETLTLMVDDATADVVDVDALVAQTIERAAAVPDDRSASGALRVISEALHALDIRDFDGPLSAAEARHARFRLLDETQFAPRLLWPTAADAAGVLIQYSTMQAVALLLPFRDVSPLPAPTPTMTMLGTGRNLLTIARVSSADLARILAPVVAPADALDRTLGAARPASVLLLRQLTHKHVAVLETAGRLYLFSIDLFVLCYIGALREEAGSPFAPFFALHRRAMAILGPEDVRRPAVLLYYIYLVYVLWQGACFDLPDLLPGPPDAGVDAHDHIQHFIVTRILRVFYASLLPTPPPAAPTLLHRLATQAPLVVPMSHEFVRAPRDDELWRKFLFFRNVNTTWFQQFRMGYLRTMDTLFTLTKHARHGNALLSHVNGHWAASRTRLALQFTPDDAADADAPATRRVSILHLVDLDAPNAAPQRVTLQFDNAHNRLLLSDASSLQEETRIIAVDINDTAPQRGVEGAAPASTRFDDAAYEELRAFMERTAAQLAAERAANADLQARVQALNDDLQSFRRAMDARLGSETLERDIMRRRIQDVERNVGRNVDALMEQQVLSESDAVRFYDALEDVAAENEALSPATAGLRETVRRTASEFAAQLAARGAEASAEQMPRLRAIARFGIGLMRGMADRILIVDDLVSHYAIRTPLLRVIRSATERRGVLRLAASEGRGLARFMYTNMRADKNTARIDFPRTSRVGDFTIDLSSFDFSIDFDETESDYSRPSRAARQRTPVDVTRSAGIFDTAKDYLLRASAVMSAAMMVLAQSAAPPSVPAGEVITLPEEPPAVQQQPWVFAGSVALRDGGRTELLRRGDAYSFFLPNDNRRRMFHNLHDVLLGSTVELYRPLDERPVMDDAATIIRLGILSPPITVVLFRQRWTTDAFFESGAHDDALDFTSFTYRADDGRMHAILPTEIVGPAPSAATRSLLPDARVSTEPPPASFSQTPSTMPVEDDGDVAMLRRQQQASAGDVRRPGGKKGAL